MHVIHINARRVVFESSTRCLWFPSMIREGWLQGCQSQKNGGKCCTRLNIRCNPGDVVFRIQLLNHDQYVTIEALGFGHLDGSRRFRTCRRRY